MRPQAVLSWATTWCWRRDAKPRCARPPRRSVRATSSPTPSDPAGFADAISRTRDDRPRCSCGRHARRNLRAQADIRAVAGDHVGQSGFVLRGDLRRAAADARGLAAGVHLVVGGARADDGPHRLLGVQSRHERVCPRLGARGRPRRHRGAHRHAGTGGNRDAAGRSLRDVRNPGVRRRRGGRLAGHRRPLGGPARDPAVSAVQRGPFARPPVVPTEARRRRDAVNSPPSSGTL